MTEAELVESAGIYYTLVGDMLSLYLTATTGFLIVVYMVGTKLTRTQLIIVSSLYLVFSIVSSYLAVGYGLRGMSYAWRITEVNPDADIYATNTVPITLGIVLMGGIIASLKFMWDVRHPKIG